MLVEKFHRFFVRYDLKFRACRRNGHPLLLLAEREGEVDIFSILNAAFSKNEAWVCTQKTDIIKITHIEHRESGKLIIILFRRSDKNASDPIFEDQDTAKIRPSDKKENEAIAVSAHLFIHTDNFGSRDFPSYSAILEEVNGISRTYIRSIMDSIIKKFKYEYSDKNGDNQETYTITDFQGVPSETVQDALTDSSVTNVTLIRPGNIEGLDVGGQVVPRDQRMKLVLRTKHETTLDVLKTIHKWATGQGWQDCRVEIDMPDERKRVVSLRDTTAAEALFVRAVRIDLKSPLDVCTESVVEELVEKAKELFGAGANGT